MKKLKEIRNYYKIIENIENYSMENQERVEHFKRLFDLNKTFFGKKILDLACGSGILGFIMEKHGMKYIGIDSNKDMIKKANEQKNMFNSRNKFILGDIKDGFIKGKFDTITFLGNSFSHFTIFDFLEILKRIRENVNKGSFFITEYRDIISMLYGRKWKKEKIITKDSKKIKIITKGINLQNGSIIQETSKNGNHFEFINAIWSPFILEALMNMFNWKLKKRVESKKWEGFLEIYQKV